MSRSRFAVVFASVVAAAFAESARADAPAEPALTDLVEILRDKGLLDEGQYTQLNARAARKDAKEHWTDRISVWGDFRSRYEGFFYHGDDSDFEDRNRLRYRLRLNGEATVNSRASILFRLASGSDDNRSTNRTLGDLPSFASDPIRIDRAYVRISPFAQGRLPDESGSAWIEFGKVPNPYVWKVGKDFMLWDHDVNPEGISVLLEDDLTQDLNIFLNAGYYVVEELKSKSSTNLMAAQLGGHLQLADKVKVGSRFSWFHFGNVGEAMLMRGVDGSSGVTSSGGNILDGLTGNVSGGHLNLLEGGFYLQADCFDDWPLLFFANVSGNVDAEASQMYPQAGRENIAWGIGGEIGDKKKWVKLGLGYWHIEANAVFSMFNDSDLFDGRTNRKGFVLYGSKQILPRTELALTAFWSRPIDDSLPNSVSKAERMRLQADMKFKF